MDVVSHLSRGLVHNAWANRETLRSLRNAGTVPARATAIMAHIVGAEWLWLRRLGEPTPEVAVWPELSPEECETQLANLSPAWRAVAEGLTPDGLIREVAYTNSKGERWANTVSDILTHVALHASYHRGQIATLLGQAGESAAYTDYIECVRRGYFE